MILGDSAYPLLPWLIKGYTANRQLLPAEKYFNTTHNALRVSVELAFGRLKARFRKLLRQSEVGFRFTPYMVVACCVLHNIVETAGDEFHREWMDAFNVANLHFPQPDANENVEDVFPDAVFNRDFIAEHIYQQGE